MEETVAAAAIVAGAHLDPSLHAWKRLWPPPRSSPARISIHPCTRGRGPHAVYLDLDNNDQSLHAGKRRDGDEVQRLPA
ncbi:hypothetical protein ACT17_06005 [Mycolicibacterium conceptionense]|uniref:Uncharacterized protein n=1 Tax=Mycolicibacterium conceptionense TaxID=451644 RepID=A0A0J8UGT2_9MYCO|nr:hypothetical protein ACT17_06005 [Mycolicibacterium conceptionense]